MYVATPSRGRLKQDLEKKRWEKLRVGKGANTHRTSATSYTGGAGKVHIVARKAASPRLLVEVMQDNTVATGKKAVGESFFKGLVLRSCHRRNPPPPVDERHSQPTIARAF